MMMNYIECVWWQIRWNVISTWWCSIQWTRHFRMLNHFHCVWISSMHVNDEHMKYRDIDTHTSIYKYIWNNLHLRGSHCDRRLSTWKRSDPWSWLHTQYTYPLAFIWEIQEIYVFGATPNWSKTKMWISFENCVFVCLATKQTGEITLNPKNLTFCQLNFQWLKSCCKHIVPRNWVRFECCGGQLSALACFMHSGSYTRDVAPIFTPCGHCSGDKASPHTRVYGCFVGQWNVCVCVR